MLSLGVAYADDEKDSKRKDSGATPAIGFPSYWGTSGMGRMIDARTPEGTFQLRGGAGYQVDVEQRTFSEALEVERREQRHEMVFYVGASALGFVDAGLRIPYVWEDIETDIKGFDNQSEFYNGWGMLEAAGKVTLELGPIALAPYLVGEIDTAEPEVELDNAVRYGVAGTFGFLNDYLSVHGNVAVRQEEGGDWTLLYRIGAAIVAWGDHNLVLRFYAYGDFAEYEGEADTDIEVDIGAQAMLFDFLTFEIGFRFRVVEGDFLDEQTCQDLEDLGIDKDDFVDDGAGSVHLAVGFLW
jgi:hypothetical protein